MPTAVSAIKVDGKRAYERVRDGEEVELKARPVTIHELVVHEVSTRSTTGVDVDSPCAARRGTYIRAIARDLGAALGVGGHLTALRRTAVGSFDLPAPAPSTSWATTFVAGRRSPRPHGRRSPSST